VLFTASPGLGGSEVESSGKKRSKMEWSGTSEER
jgi:hypothetical protein